MSITVRPGATFTAILTDAPQGLVGTLTLGVRELPSETVFSAAAATEITESTQPDSTSNYSGVRTAPTDTTQEYEVFWTNGSIEITEDLHIVGFAPPLGGDLTDLEGVRKFMQKGDTGETEQDELIESLIPAASQQIQQFTRIIAPAETGVTKTFQWLSGGCLSFDPWFCRSVTSVSFDGGTAITDGWTLEPVDADEGVYRALNMDSYVVDVSALEMQDPVFMRSLRRSVVVTGDWGFAAVPDYVRNAANVTVREWIASEVSAFVSGFDAGSDRFIRGKALPDGVTDALKHLARDEYR